MGSYCCIKTISTQKESSIRIEEFSKGISNLNNKKNEYIPLKKKISLDIKNYSPNQSNLITKANTFEKKSPQKKKINQKKKNKIEEIKKRNKENNTNDNNNNKKSNINTEKKLLKLNINDLDNLRTNKYYCLYSSVSMNQRKRKIFELLPSKGKLNFLSSTPLKEKFIKLNCFDSDRDEYNSSTKCKTLEKFKLSEFQKRKQNLSASNIKKLKENNNDLPIKIINEKLTNKQKEFIKKILIENELLYPEMNNEIIEMILNTIIYEKVKSNIKLFTKDQKKNDYYFILEKGKLEYSTDEEIYELPKGNGISTQSLLENTKNNCYIKTINKCYLFILPFEKYKKIANDYEKKRNNEILKYLQKCYFFSNLDIETQEKIAEISNFIDCEEKTLILEQHKLSDCIYLILKGKVFCSYNNLIIKAINEGDLFLETGIFNRVESFYSYLTDNETILLQIKYEDLIPIFKEQGIKNIIYKIFEKVIKENKYLNQFINTEEIIKKVFLNFELKFYYQNIIMFNNQKKILLPISGTIFKEKKMQELQNFIHSVNLNYKNQIEKGKIYMDTIIKEESINYNILGDECIIFEIEFENLIPIISFNQIKEISIKDLIFILKNNPQFNFLSSFTIFNLANSMKKKEYKQGDLILKNGPFSNKFFYIKEGEVQIVINEKEIKTLSNNNSFGDILSEKNSYSRNANFFSLTKTIIYTLNKKKYEEIVDKENPLFQTLKKLIVINDITINLNSLYYVKDIGRGSYGKVYLVCNEKRYFAIKTVEIKSLYEKKEMAKLYLSEKIISSSIEHPFIVHLFNTYKTRDYLFFLMEFVDGISLRKKINESKKKNQLKNYEETQFYGAILFSVLNYLQNKRIIHRDLKPDNIIINTNGYLKVIDFGVAKNLEKKDYTNTIIGTSYYMSPEVILGKPYNFNADYWSLGIILYEIYYGKLPFNKNDEAKFLYENILNLKLYFSNDSKSENFNNLICNLLDKNQKNRISSFKAIKNHKFFKNFDFDALNKFMIKPQFIPKETVSDINIHELISFISFINNNNDSNSSGELDNYINKQVEEILYHF